MFTSRRLVWNFCGIVVRMILPESIAAKSNALSPVQNTSAISGVRRRSKDLLKRFLQRFDPRFDRRSASELLSGQVGERCVHRGQLG